MIVEGFRSMSKLALMVSFRKSYSSNIGYSSSLQRFFHILREKKKSDAILSSETVQRTSIFVSFISNECTLSSSSSISSLSMPTTLVNRSESCLFASAA